MVLVEWVFVFSLLSDHSLSFQIVTCTSFYLAVLMGLDSNNEIQVSTLSMYPKDKVEESIESSICWGVYSKQQ